MAQGIIANVSRAAVGHALREARIACAHSIRWTNALNRAALDLEACRWAFDGETLVIASATTQGTRYTVSPDGCGCKAHQDGRPCWHRAARRLLVKAAELAAAGQPAKSMAELQAAVDDLFA